MTTRISVLVTAYEQANWIGEAIESVLVQEVQEPIEIVVGVDASRDGTAEVVRCFEKKWPERIRGIYHSKRMGLFENFRAVLTAASGSHVALLEGDDFWTDHRKLARQVAVLDARPEVVCVAHSVEVRDAAGRTLGQIPRNRWAEDPSRIEVLESYCDVHTSSLCFRKALVMGALDRILNPQFKVYDLPLKLALLAKGNFAFVSESWSVFRRHEGAATLGVSDCEWMWVIANVYREFRSEFQGELRVALDRVLTRLSLQLATAPEGYRRVVAGLLALRYGGWGAALGLLRGGYALLPQSVQAAYRFARSHLLRLQLKLGRSVPTSGGQVRETSNGKER